MAAGALLLLACPGLLCAQVAPVSDQAPANRTRLTAGEIQTLLDRSYGPLRVAAGSPTTLVQIIAQLEGTKREWIDLPTNTLGYLPYGIKTPVMINLPRMKLRRFLHELLDPMSLDFRIVQIEDGKAMLRIEPRPELIRIGRRATIDEVELLRVIRTVKVARGPLVGQLRKAASRADIAIQFDLAGWPRAKAIAGLDELTGRMERSTFAGVLDQYCAEHNWAWRVDRMSVRVLDKPKQVLHQLHRTVVVRWNNVELDEALIELGSAAGVLVQFQPAMMEGVEQQNKRLTWTIPSQTILQTMEKVSGRTGLAYEVREESVYFYAPRLSRWTSDPPIFVELPLRTGGLSIRGVIRKSMLPEELHAAYDEKLKRAADALAEELRQDMREKQAEPAAGSDDPAADDTGQD
jgi:hypothetical protein